MNHAAQVCPLCNGKGNLPDEASQKTTAPCDKPCHGCHGNGIVWPPGAYYPPVPYIQPYAGPVWPWPSTTIWGTGSVTVGNPGIMSFS